MQDFIEQFPIAGFVFLVYALAGAGALLIGELDNGQYVDSLLKVGAGTGAIGFARAHLRRPSP